QRSEGQFTQRYVRGNPMGPLVRNAPTERHGTHIRFRPDPEIFASVEMDLGPVSTRLRELACMFPTLRVTLTVPSRGISARAGLADLVNRWVVPADRALHQSMVHRATASDVTVELAIRLVPGRRGGIVRGYVNTQLTTEGGTHVEGFSDAISALASGIT